MDVRWKAILGLFIGIRIVCKLLILKWYAWQGSNLRPSVPETDALVQLSYRRTLCLTLILLDIFGFANPNLPHIRCLTGMP